MAEPSESRPGLISADTAAKLVMVSTERLRQLAKQGYIQKAQRGQYVMVSVVQGYIRFLKDEERRSSKSAAESGLKQARQREVELRIAREEFKVIDFDEHIAVVEELVGMFTAALQGLPASVTRDIEQRQEIQRECDGIRARLAARSEQRSEELRTSGKTAASEAEDDT